MPHIVFTCTHCGQRIASGTAQADDLVTCPNCQTAQAIPAAAEPPAPPPAAAPRAPAPELPYAGFWPRALAWSLDLVVLSCVGGLIGVLAGPVALPLDAGPHDPKMLLLHVLGTLINWLYFAGMESSRWQATLGKTAVGIRVTDLNGQRVTFGRASARHFAKIFSVLTFGIGFLLIALTQRRQALHDMVAACLVVRAR